MLATQAKSDDIGDFITATQRRAVHWESNQKGNTMINVLELQEVLQELSELTSKPHWTKTNERRNEFLLAAQAGIKQGVSLREINRERLGEFERKNNLPVTRFNKDADEFRDARCWSTFLQTGNLPVVEYRDTAVDDGKPEYLPGNDGAFVPLTFFENLKPAMRWMDPLIDPAVCTVVETDHGRPMQIGFYDDTAQYAAVIGENVSNAASESDLTGVAEIDVSAWSYRTNPFRMDISAFQDLAEMTSAIALFSTFSSKRLGRGIGRDLTVNGNGSGKPLSLLNSLVTSGNCQAAVCTGSSESTGGSQTGANSIGVTDISNLYFAVDNSYRQSPKCAWLMNDSTRSFLSRIINKQGNPVWGDLTNGRNLLMGKNVYTSPSMASIGAGNIPIVFGALDYWISRHATAGDKVTVLKEIYADKAQVGLRCWQRWDGALCYSSAVSGTPPIMYLINHS